MFFGIIYDSGNRQRKEIKFTKKILDLSIPSQKSEFDNWVNGNLLSISNDTTAKKYESESRYDFAGDTKKCYFEDCNFEVYSECAGEWGGSLLFVDKKNKGKIYYLSSTCPKMIDFKEGKYIITSTLAHMSGSADITILENPRELAQFQKSKFNDEFKEKYMNHMLQLPTPKNVLRHILDTSGITVNVYYPYQDRHFIIFSEYNASFVGEVQNGKIINKEPLINYGIWGTADKLNKIKNQIYISEINKSSTSIDMKQALKTNESLNGMIYIKEDTIVVGYKYNKVVEKE